MEILKGQNIQLAYDEKVVIDEIDFSINKGEIVSIIGTNGCGKSTLLKAIARVLNCKKGEIYLENNKIQDIKNKDFAKKLAFVSQNNEIPEDITVYDFIMYGRIPHKKWYEIYNEEDRNIVEWAIKICHLEKFRERKVMSLSGGERQKVWISMVLAQENNKIQDIKNKDFAKKLAFVSQNNEIPEDITVYDFIMYGRIPHKKWYEIYNEEDRNIVEWAIKFCHLEKFRERKVMSLSGGERQKVWISMVLAQKTEILLLDEPTTYLDIYIFRYMSPI